ncbi:transglycosylase domain-containing protein [Aquabacterium sp. A7-Y]|uniref:penicillin-binding protein 1A n=1 Tax=Aquabacterium sp. A7-Y TaxID=1349605 RepID=UPI00223D6CB1|nr:transglycosylase domain-containing protein [Aquabacterium sp. A7-Y]MCW7540831.1 transglycosylase domain-containing protein [Aquabacterium sp. A7-Y]
MSRDSLPPSEARPPRRQLLPRGLRRVLLLLVVALPLALAVYLTLMAASTPDAEALRSAHAERPSVLLSADGKTLATFRRAAREPVTLDRISPLLVKALIATEDHRFHEHEGIDFVRSAAAVLHTLSGDPQGGSTLTQQLARNLFPEEIGRSRSLNRKVKEMIAARRIEKVLSKQQILESYLNNVPFLYGVVGIEMAARTYFGKAAAQLDALESATLVGMLKGTYYYNPVIHPERARARRNVVLGQMARHGVIDEAQLRSLSTRPLDLEFTRPSEDLGSAPHFAAHVRKWLSEWAEERGMDLYRDGLVVHTTLDSRLQAAAESSLREQAAGLQQVAAVEWSRAALPSLGSTTAAYRSASAKAAPFAHFWRQGRQLEQDFIRESAEFKKRVASGIAERDALAQLQADEAFLTRLREDKTRLEAGFVAIDPRNGEVRAWVGSRDFARDQFDHVAQAQRQPGSTFKPFVYAAALANGIEPYRLYLDAPVEVRQADGSVWRPTDMSGFSGREMSLREGLIHSKNTITAQVMQQVGVVDVVALARAAGVRQSRLDPVPSLALGTSPVTLLEMATAYATIAAQGDWREPVLVRRITDAHGEVLAQFVGDSRTAFSADVAVELIDMMRGVMREGTGAGVRQRFGLEADFAGKTGTTQNNTDGWFMLMHPELVGGAWVGFNDQRVTLRSDYWGQGAHNAALVVGDFFRSALKMKALDAKASFPPSRYPPPPPMPPELPEDAASDLPSELPDPLFEGEGSAPPSPLPGIDDDGPPPEPGASAPLPPDAAAPKGSAELERVVRSLRQDVREVPPPSDAGAAPPPPGGVRGAGAGAVLDALRQDPAFGQKP